MEEGLPLIGFWALSISSFPYWYKSVLFVCPSRPSSISFQNKTCQQCLDLFLRLLLNPLLCVWWDQLSPKPRYKREHARYLFELSVLNLIPRLAWICLPCWPARGIRNSSRCSLTAYLFYFLHVVLERKTWKIGSWNVRYHWKGKEETARICWSHSFRGSIEQKRNAFDSILFIWVTIIRTSPPEQWWMFSVVLCKTSILKVIPVPGEQTKIYKKKKTIN